MRTLTPTVAMIHAVEWGAVLRVGAFLLAACVMSPCDAAPVPAPLPALAAASTSAGGERIPLRGHVVPLQAAMPAGSEPPARLTLTLTLNRDDEPGFAQYLRDVYDPASPSFRHFLNQGQIAERFGPSTAVVDRLSAWLQSERLAVVEGSANRLTLTVAGDRADVERAFGVQLTTYTNGARAFYAAASDPSLPSDLAPHVLAIAGLADLALPRSINQTLPTGNFDCPANVSAEDCNLYGPVCELYSASRATGELLQTIGGGAEGFKDYAEALNTYSEDLEQYFYDCLNGTFTDLPANAPTLQRPSMTGSGVAWNSVTGAGQTIGIVAFDNYQTYDVANYLHYIASSAPIANLSTVCVGACASFGAGENEVLLDVDAAMSFAPGANVIVYSGGFPGSGSSFQNIFNRMLSDGLVTIISNSWAYCEDQTSLADVQSIDSILQSAAAGGISVFSGSGDSGGTCLDGAANTIAVPADAPHITAVGGTTLHAGAGGVYKGESWWDGSTHTPRTGQGGFGTSRYFTRPAFQDTHTAAAMRSIPDVSAPADPVNGLQICQTDAGGCPTGSLFGGTSLAAPAWAAFTALLNQAHGSNLGFVNPAFYPLSATNAFHNGASMGSDFAHVGLGSPNLDALNLGLAGQSPGTPDANQSEILPTTSPTNAYATVPGVPADGQSAAVVVVKLRDANGNTVPNKTVALTANAGNHATITPPSGSSSVADGTVVFTVTDLTPETVTFTANDTTDSVMLARHPTMAFVTPPAAFSAMSAFPTTQASDGSSTSTVTVTLEDTLHRPSPGKQVLLRQFHNSMIVTANPATTDVNGQAQFNVADQVAEGEHYVAVDQTDGNIDVNGSADVLFSGSSAACAIGPAPLAGPGYRLDVYASGFPVQANSTYGGVNIFGCLGVSGLAFDAAGNLFAAEISGDVYKFPAGGGVAGAATKLASNAGQGLGGLTYGKDGKLYGVRLSTDGTSPATGALVKIDQSTGAATAVASGILCPFNLTTDPLSGDLFVADFCGFASISPTVKRVIKPDTPDQSVVSYADTEGGPNGSVSIAPDGTLYVVSNYFGQGSIDEIAGTDKPQAIVTPTGVYSTYSAAAFGSNPDGGAQALVTSVFNTGGFDHSVAAWDMTATPPSFSGATLVASDIGAVKVFDANGCLYLTNANVVYKVSNADGSCPLAGLAVNPSAVLVPETEPALASQGTTMLFDVTFPHSSVAAGTPVTYVVSGSNHSSGLALVGANGKAIISYAGARSGIDTVTAYATLGGTPVASNPVLVTWNENKHVTRISLDNAVTSATIGTAVTVSATLLDLSIASVPGVANATIQFTLSGQTCSGITDGQGRASCVIPVSAATQCALAATYAGGPSYLASTATQLFSVSRYDVLFANGFEPPLIDGSCVLY